MVTSVLPAEDAQRKYMAVLDADIDPLFDALARSAAAATSRPMAFISLVDPECEGSKACFGFPAIVETVCSSIICTYGMLDDGLLEVGDTRCDTRFADSLWVTGSPHIRFYAGAPIVLDDGPVLGSLCVLDIQPGSLQEVQRATLKALADAVAEALKLRRLALARRQQLGREAEALQQQVRLGGELQQQLRASEALLERTSRLAAVGGWELDLVTQQLTWSAETFRIHDLPLDYEPQLERAVRFYAPEARELLDAAIKNAVEQGDGWDLQLPLVTAKHRHIWVRAVGTVDYAEDGPPLRLVGIFQDVTLRHRAIAALEASDRRFRKFFEYSLGLICTHDYEGTLLSVNPAAAESLGYSVGEMIGRPLSDFTRPERHQALRDYLLRMMTHDSDAGMLELTAKDGTLRYWQYHNVLDDESDEPYVLGHAQDVTEREKNERKLREWSIRDSLTGCFNRRYLAELAPTIPAQRWSCIAIDLDYFKQVNDTHGHERGDQVLVAMAKFLTDRVRPDDAVIRLGGDEFLLLLRGADEGVAAAVVDRINHDRSAAPIAFTLGVATLEPGVTLEAGMVKADQCLYQLRAARPPRAR